MLFLTKTEAEKKGYHQELGINILIENKDTIFNAANWYWCDDNNIIMARCYYNEIDAYQNLL